MFGIQQAAIVVERAGRPGRPPLRARVDLQFGQGPRPCRAAPPTSRGPSCTERLAGLRHVRVPGGRGLQTDFGKFASNLGYETNYAKDNNHFSRAYLFNFLPFYHSGLRVSLPVPTR